MEPQMQVNDPLFDTTVGKLWPRGHQLTFNYPLPGEPFTARMMFRDAVIALDANNNPQLVLTGVEQTSSIIATAEDLTESFELIDISTNTKLNKTMTLEELLVAISSFGRHMVCQPGGGII